MAMVQRDDAIEDMSTPSSTTTPPKPSASAKNFAASPKGFKPLSEFINCES